MFTLSFDHNFETAHRFTHPESSEKCRSIHGHSWRVIVDVESPTLDERGMVVEFGDFKRAWRGFVDGHVDHHLVLNANDPVMHAIREILPESRILSLPFDPTTENLARWLFERAEAVLAEVVAGEKTDVRVSRIRVEETAVNAAEYAPRR